MNNVNILFVISCIFIPLLLISINYDLKMISKMYKEYIKNRIQLFLIWHESEGRNVTRINSFQQYLQEFYSQIDKDFYSKFNGNNKKNNQYIETLQKGLILDKTIQAFDAIANPTIGFGQDVNTSKFFLHNISTVGKYVWHWPYYMEMIQFRDRKQNEPINYIENPQKTLDIGNHITIDGKHITYYDVVKNKLEEIGINKGHAENVLSYIWDRQHKQLESLNAIEF